MRKKTIILIRNAQPYDFGGAERFPIFTAKVLQENYGTPYLISRSPSLLKYADDMGVNAIKGPWWGYQNWSGVRVVLFPIYILWQFFLFFWYLILFLRYQPDVIHLQSKDDFIAATFAGRLTGARVIWTDHADLKHIWRNLEVWYKNPTGKLVYIASHFAHNITVISKSEYREITKYLSKKSKILKKIVIIHNGSPDVRGEYTNRSKNEDFVFCSTNRLVRDKGIKEIIEAFKKFHKKYPKSRLILVGNGLGEKYFKKLASDEPAITFTGFQSDPLSFVSRADVLLQPTYHEGFSISILEGFMLQKPVIATSVGGNVEMIINNENGILVPAKDSNALYGAMIELYTDPSKRGRIAKKGRAIYVQKFVFDTIIKKEFIPLYEGAVK